jgi:hypothetical protein
MVFKWENDNSNVEEEIVILLSIVMSLFGKTQQRKISHILRFVNKKQNYKHVQVVAIRANPIQITRGINKTTKVPIFCQIVGLG